MMQTDQWGCAQTILMYHQKDRLRRDMMNNGKIYESVENALRESIVPSAEVSKRYNATYGASDFNVGMLHAAMLDTSVGGCSFTMREITAQSIENPRYSRHSPSDEWFRDILSRTGEGRALETFNQAVRAQLDELCLLGRLHDVLDVAIDMHLIPCHSKKLGSDLRGGERKSGTNRLAYITAQCVNSKSRLILAAHTWTSPHSCTNPCVKSSICAWKTSLPSDPGWD